MGRLWLRESSEESSRVRSLSSLAYALALLRAPLSSGQSYPVLTACPGGWSPPGSGWWCRNLYSNRRVLFVITSAIKPQGFRRSPRAQRSYLKEHAPAQSSLARAKLRGSAPGGSSPAARPPPPAAGAPSPSQAPRPPPAPASAHPPHPPHRPREARRRARRATSWLAAFWH